ncbi:hypothetical protein PFICI_04669 [Pestalotiopsis fici W106-1]|uniref:Uncharacterized protein n=1 Tax=Pestalotiopsis fici (strain W106-1 / CGMCC3.15140) TaxID=1229662 RepID=W3X9L1_PESFW|nr:uncharacterized protein PFICI_04669 [Pestalotiopsis fici W106-1]ETS82793.1 hypothetical protein PFICI_04669 [Pestalotiopsis fici W106-1]
MTTPEAKVDDIRYEQLVRHLLRSVKDMENNTNRRQLDIRRLLEGPLSSPQQPPHAREVAIQAQQQQRLPHNFGGQSHDAVNQRWSPSGIKWRYARQGAQLATDAANELHDSDFERSAYIDAVAYYLRACPDQLDHGETAKILSAAPWLAQHPRPQPQIAGIARPTDRGRTFLSDAVQYAVIGLILLGHMLWCLFLSAIRIGAHLEREYQLSHWVATNGFDLVNSVGRHSVAWTAKINAMNEGRIGQVVSWTMDSVTGGIQEGYGKGMDRIRRQQQTITREAHPQGDTANVTAAPPPDEGGGIVGFRWRKPYDR